MVCLCPAVRELFMVVLNQCTVVTDPGSVKSLGLLKSMCTGLYQSTRKQGYVYCCSESARSVL